MGKWGEFGAEAGQLNAPSGIAFDSSENMYVADGLNHRVQKFTKEGEFLATWGGLGSGDGEFNMPWGVTVDEFDDVYVSDWRNDRIQKFTPTEISSSSLAAAAAATGSSTGRQGWRWTSTETSTWRTRGMTGCSCSTKRGASSRSSSETPLCPSRRGRICCPTHVSAAEGHGVHRRAEILPSSPVGARRR